MKVTGPNNTEPCEFIEDIATAVDLFEKALKKSKSSVFLNLIIPGECTKPVCKEVEGLYLDVGWVKVKCTTSFEEGLLPGYTILRLMKFH